jgi:hypothetical protein
MEVHPANLPSVQGDHLHRRASEPHGCGGDGEFNHLKSMGGEYRNSPPCEGLAAE